MSFDPADFIDNLNSSRTEAALSVMADDIEWHVPGDPAFGGGVYRGRDGLQDFLGVVTTLFPDGLKRVWSRSWQAPGGFILETTLEGVAVTGRTYRNNYAFVFVLNEGGKVCEVREYQDVAPLAEALEGWEES